MDPAKKDVSGKTKVTMKGDRVSTVGGPLSITVTQGRCVGCVPVEACLRSQDSEELAR